MSELFQLHWQFKNGKTEMKAQKEISSNAEMKVWEKDVCKRHPLPEGAIWMICTEESEYFVMAATP